jgi:uncharacterized protein (TIGR02118 family)
MSWFGCNTGHLKKAMIPEKGMYKVAILYPAGEGKNFDLNYYEAKHMPMMAGILGKNLAFYEIDKGLSGRTPADPLPYVTIGYFYIRDLAAYNKAIAENITAILEDIKKYTNIQPTIQISEILQVQVGG